MTHEHFTGHLGDKSFKHDTKKIQTNIDWL